MGVYEQYSEFIYGMVPLGGTALKASAQMALNTADVADLIKDALVLPLAFICAKEDDSEQEFRQQLLQSFIDHKALDYMFDMVKEIALGESE